MNTSAEIAAIKRKLLEWNARLPAAEEKPVVEHPKFDALERNADGAVVLQDGIASYEDRQVAARQEWERQAEYEKQLSREGVPPGFYRDLVLGGVIRRTSDNRIASPAEVEQARLEAARNDQR